MKIYNTCPICGKDLLNSISHYNPLFEYYRCSCYVLYINSGKIEQEEFYIDGLLIIRSKHITWFYDFQNLQINFTLNIALDFNKFNTITKIKNLLILI